jgi:hypothetical protein
MLERLVANTGQLPQKRIADAGYCSTDNIERSEQRGLDAYLSTSRQDHGKRPRPSRGPAPRDLDARSRMDRKIRSTAGQAIHALRKTIDEPVFGQIKGARGLDRFLSPLRTAPSGPLPHDVAESNTENPPRESGR